MRLLLQNPIWFAAALLAVPILAHLFSKTRPRPRQFPSIRLLQEALRRVNRVQRPRDRWLLVLRTLAMAALAFAFLQPLLMSRFSSGSNTARTLVVAIDVSASMGYSDGSRTRLAQATAAAEDLISSLPANSRANVVWIGANPSPALPEPGANLDFLRQALRGATVRPEPGDVPGAIALALKQLGQAEGERELAVISDFQRSAWREAKLEMPSGIQLTRMAVGDDAAENVGLGELTLEPGRPIAGQEARVVATVRNFSSIPRRATVFAEAGESRLSQTVEVAPWGETLAIMPVTFPQEGTLPLRATLSEDRFPGDDVRHGIAEVRGALRIDIAGATDDVTAKTWTRAAGALDSVSVRRIQFSEIGGSPRAELLFVSNWEGQQLPLLQQHLSQGGALVIQPSVALASEVLSSLLPPASPATAQPAFLQSQAADPGWTLRIAQEEHPMFALFAKGTYGDPVNARFTRRAPVASPAGTTLISYSDGAPALLLADAAPGAGRSTVAWWALDLSATDWPTRSGFIGFFGEFVRYLAQRTGKGGVPATEPGELLRFDAGTAVDPADIALLDSTEREVKIAPESARAATRLMSLESVPPGAYRWTAQGNVLGRSYVNFPAAESDLRRMKPEDFGGAGGEIISDAGKARIAALRTGSPLWPWCLAAAAFFFLLEALWLWRLPIQGAVAKPVTPAAS